MGELNSDERGESEAFQPNLQLTLEVRKLNGKPVKVRREDVFKCLTNLSIVTGAVSIAFIVFIAFLISGFNYFISILISIFLSLLYITYRIIAEIKI